MGKKSAAVTWTHTKEVQVIEYFQGIDFSQYRLHSNHDIL